VASTLLCRQPVLLPSTSRRRKALAFVLLKFTDSP
jgi:hypothetical protein